MFSPISSKLVLLAMMKILSLPVLAQTLGSLNNTGITMGEISYGGTGCPQGSLSFVYTISDTRFATISTTILQISDQYCRGVAVFNGYTASMGQNISVRESRKNCQINLNIEYPSGTQYSPVSVGYSGYANLDDGVQGLHQTTYYFTGSMHQGSPRFWQSVINKNTGSDQVSSNHSFAGATSTAYSYEEAIDPTGTVIWSPCNSSTPLNINNQVRLTKDSNSTGNGVLYDSGIVDLTLQWRSC